jgi:putative transposase
MNRKHHRVGHLFQGRYKAILIYKEFYLLELCRYIVLNPVRVRMVDKTFAKKRSEVIALHIHFIKQGVGKTIWDILQHQ